ncbi:hypothetical protein B7463_g7517, partial [Scytalidium lignicola]
MLTGFRTATATATSTITVTGYYLLANKRDEVQAPNVKARDIETAITVSPTAIPAYAAPCSGSVRYSSACSCAGATAATTTAPAPVTTTTTTTVVTVTATPSGIPVDPYCSGGCYCCTG